jgi:hypothetical protein
LSQHLNIVSFDVPYPANYGGAIDVFYKVKWLHSQGVKVHLHCFTYGRPPAPELEPLCEETTYYRRRTGLWSNFSLLPYTVRSRRSALLKKNLLKNDYPILFEVLHTCFLMKDAGFARRKKIYRHSNIEHTYYYEIARAEKNILRKVFHYVEGWRLKRFEGIIAHADLILAVNEKDTDYFRRTYPRVPAVYLPSFHANDAVNVKEGRGDFALIHGNLGVSENYEAVLWLLNNVLTKVTVRTIVAGLNPPAFLVEKVKKMADVELVANPSEHQMQSLIREAQVHLLYTGQPTGLKLKLLNVLFCGRFVLCNSNMLSGTPLKPDSGLYIADTSEKMSVFLLSLMEEEFSADRISERRSTIANFDNSRNIKLLIDSIF